jgi:hypothetical protein
MKINRFFMTATNFHVELPSKRHYRTGHGDGVKKNPFTKWGEGIATQDNDIKRGVVARMGILGRVAKPFVAIVG